MSRRRKKYLSAGVACLLCSTALVDLTRAQPAVGNGRPLPTIPLHACFQTYLPSPSPPMPYVHRPKSWAKKAALSTPWITLPTP